MLSLCLFLKIFDVAFELFYVVLCHAEILFTLSKFFLYGDLVNLEIRILLQRGLVESRSRLSQRFLEEVYLEFETEVLFFNFVDDL